MTGSDFINGLKYYLELIQTDTLDLVDHHNIQEELAVDFRGLPGREQIRVYTWLAALQKKRADA